MFIPYKDDNPRILVPYVTWTIMGINILIFLYQLLLNQESYFTFLIDYSAIPNNIVGDGNLALREWGFSSWLNPYLTIITSLFLHGGFMHLIGNMVFLYIFADNVESILGHKKFILYFLLCGIIATLTQIWISSDSVVPIIGASGAISGIMAGYMLKYPSARIHTLVFVFPVVLPAVVVVGFWFATQVMNGFGNLYNADGGGVAWFSHIGGFVAGGLVMFVISKGKFYWLKDETRKIN